MALRPGAEQNMMVEVNYRQGRDGTTLNTVVQDVYLCASMEFLLTVADIFLKAMQHGFAQVPQAKSSAAAGDKKNINSSVTSKESSESGAVFWGVCGQTLCELNQSRVHDQTHLQPPPPRRR